MQQYFMPIYTTLVGALIGFLLGKLKDLVTKAKESREKEDDIASALKDGMAILLRDKLTVYYDAYKFQDSIPKEEWEGIEQVHSVYNRLGGNHTGDRLFNEMKNKILE